MWLAAVPDKASQQTQLNQQNTESRKGEELAATAADAITEKISPSTVRPGGSRAGNSSRNHLTGQAAAAAARAADKRPSTGSSNALAALTAPPPIPTGNTVQPGGLKAGNSRRSDSAAQAAGSSISDNLAELAGGAAAGAAGAGAAAAAGVEQSSGSTRKLLSHPATWAIILVNFVNDWGFFIYLNWMPTYFYKVSGYQQCEIKQQDLGLHALASKGPRGLMAANARPINESFELMSLEPKSCVVG